MAFFLSGWISKLVCKNENVEKKTYDNALDEELGVLISQAGKYDNVELGKKRLPFPKYSDLNRELAGYESRAAQVRSSYVSLLMRKKNVSYAQEFKVHHDIVKKDKTPKDYSIKELEGRIVLATDCHKKIQDLEAALKLAFEKEDDGFLSNLF